MEIKILVQNVKCGGCAANIQEKLSAHVNVQQVDAVIDTGEVTIQCDKDITDEVKQILNDIGYPPK